MDNIDNDEVNIIPVIPLSIDDIDFEAIDCIPTGLDINLVEDLELDRGMFHFFLQIIIIIIMTIIIRCNRNYW